ncbi:MAG: magnesium transporter [Methylococcaceae bacterium TMED69]|nr:MAG: magnesium transporter [Methylococcaceae bacterium TMED69]
MKSKHKNSIRSNQELLHDVQNILENYSIDNLDSFLADLHSSEISDLLESMESNNRVELFERLDAEKRGEVLSELSVSIRRALLKFVGPEGFINETSSLEPDDLADIIQGLPEPMADRVLLSMDAQNRDRVAESLHYPSNTAGGLMNVDVLTVRPDVEVDVVLRFFRRFGPVPENQNQLFVVDRSNKLLGSVMLLNLLMAEPEIPIGDLMQKVSIPINAFTDAREVTLIFERYDLIEAPVINEENKFLGFISVDDVVDVLMEETDRSLLSSAGLATDYDMFAPIIKTSSKRSVWLAVNLATAFLAAWVIGLFETTIENMVALAILMPVVASMGGIAGTQTLTIVIRGLSIGQVGSANSRSVVFREIIIGFFNGCLWAWIVALISSLWFDNFGLGAIIGAAMIVNLVTAGFFGATIPLTLDKLGIDPALAGGVMVTTITDVVGFFAFLGLASYYLV